MGLMSILTAGMFVELVDGSVVALAGEDVGIGRKTAMILPSPQAILKLILRMTDSLADK